MKKNLKLILFIILLFFSIAIICTCSYFIAQYQEIYQISNSIKLWELYGLIIALIIGCGLLISSSIAILEFLYVNTKNGIKNKELYE